MKKKERRKNKKKRIEIVKLEVNGKLNKLAVVEVAVTLVVQEVVV